MGTMGVSLRGPPLILDMRKEDLELLVEEGLEGCSCRATDLTGTEDHWRLEVSWPGFGGLSMLDQHRAVMAVLRPKMVEGTNEIHAVEIVPQT